MTTQKLLKPSWIVRIFGALAGFAIMLNVLATYDQAAALDSFSLVLFLVVAPGFIAAMMSNLRSMLCWLVQRYVLPADVFQRYSRYDVWLYAFFLVTYLGAFGIVFSTALMIILLLIFFSLHVLLIMLLLSQSQRSQFFISSSYVGILFLLSGIAALIYQIVWHRVLFTFYGTNIETTTIIVSIFMFGLGVGALVGGYLSKRLPRHLASLFLFCEIVIGAFGAISLALIAWVGQAMVNGSLLDISLSVYALLCVPTMVMAASLPILVAHIYRYVKNIGHTVSLLYGVNTLGSAAACFLTVDVLFVFLGLQASVYIAAALNIIVGLLVYRYAKRLQATQGAGA